LTLDSTAFFSQRSAGPFARSRDTFYELYLPLLAGGAAPSTAAIDEGWLLQLIKNGEYILFGISDVS